ncbi:hypothetical protein NM208_g8019 [Fusarium decemcellulare]|uniref:Uncharacterized protein n=1 Tax=Fusarium decemcellulare TaxID=57161 RepID=A0ACC1S749_9HYPO|nr:hypothetical protein NM208_g8019 [Fusarium decemcellulare]
MADPFSIASGVVGVVSLGITLCDGLHTFLSAVKGYDEDVELASQRLAVLRSNIDLIQSSASTLSGRYGSASQGVIQGLELCERQLQVLDRTLGELDHAGGSSKWQKIAKYPFSRNKLIQIQDQLLWATATLGTFVQSLILHVNIGVGSDLEAFRSAVKDSSYKTHASLDALDNRLEFIGPLVQESDSKLTAVSAQVWEQSMLSSTSHSIIQRVNSEVISQSSQLTAISSGINDIRTLCQSRLLEKNEGKSLPRFARNTKIQRQRNRDFTTRSCSCASLKSNPSYYEVHRSRRSFLGLTITHQTESTRKHFPGCVFYLADSVEISTVSSITYTGLRWLLAREAALSLHSNSRKGASWITHELRAYHIVEKSPVFDLFRHYFLRRSCCHRGFGNKGRELMRELQLIYSSGSSSPLEMTSGGWNVVHHCIQTFASFLVCAGQDTIDDIMDALRSTLQYLYEIGADINASTFDQQTILDVALDDETRVFLQVYNTLNEYPQFDPAINSTHQIFDQEEVEYAWKGSFYEHIDIAKALGFGDLFLVVLQRDEGALRDIIESNRLVEYLAETDSDRRNVLHKCSDWAPGLRFLLGHEATHGILNDLDGEQFAPVHHALRQSGDICHSIDKWSYCEECNCSETLQLMLEADCSVWIHGHTKWQHEILKECSLKARTLFLTHLKDRRERLQDLAMTHLPRDTLENIEVCKRAVSDLMVRSIRDALDERGIEMGTALEYLWHPSGGFDNAGFFATIDCPKVADLAWSLGFQSDSADSWLTGWLYNLGTSDILSKPDDYLYKKLIYAGWLYQKGAQLDDLVSESSRGHQCPRLSSDLRHCSTRNRFPGRTAISIASTRRAAASLFENIWSYPFRGIEDGLIVACSLISLLREHGNVLDLSLVSKSIIHVLTMRPLGIRHLRGCQVGDWKDMSEPDLREEWNEILDEDRFLIEELEELTGEFNGEFACKNVPFEEFLWECWLPRMKQIEADRNRPLSKRQKESLWEAGVILDEVEDKDQIS